MGLQYGNGLVCFGLVEGEDHADTHIEYVEHLPVRHFAVFLQEAEYRKDFP